MVWVIFFGVLKWLNGIFVSVVVYSEGLLCLC